MIMTNYNGIAIDAGNEHFPGFERSVGSDLDQINATPTGRILLAKISAGHPRVTSAPIGMSVSFRPGVNVIIVPKRSHYIQSGFKITNVTTSSGALSQVLERSSRSQHNPEGRRFYARIGALTVAADRDAAKDRTGSVAVVNYSNAAMSVIGGQVTPPFIVLAHELIHAANDIHGHQMDDQSEEEQRVVGIAAWSNAPMMPLTCENQIRMEAGLPSRTSYP